MATEQPIVIIGAGPVGLVAALTLLQQGQKVVIYDALARGRNGSRAGAVHAHTLEVRLFAQSIRMS
jgi:2-polyprenyl-6-methoxyphenol hydroxylase-like FAD-dependent oxidoreductase